MSIPSKMNASEVTAFLDEVFPQVNAGKRTYFVDSVANGEGLMRLEADERHLRPGNTVSGPTLFTLADLAAYATILSAIGSVALAVTTNLNINFLRKPEAGTIMARGKILKLGKRLCVVDIAITAKDSDDLLAHASATYSIPPR